MDFQHLVQSAANNVINAERSLRIPPKLGSEEKLEVLHQRKSFEPYIYGYWTGYLAALKQIHLLNIISKQGGENGKNHT